jgi:hypothetical protein
MDEVGFGQIFSEYFGFPCKSIHQLISTHHHPSSEAGTLGQIVVDVPAVLPHSTKVNKTD